MRHLTGGVGRRDFLRGTATLVGALALPSAMPSPAWAARRRPDSLPFPKAPPGEDMIPEIEHIVVAMMENHTYDNYFGVLDRGDGFKLDHGGRPRKARPGRNGNFIRALPIPPPRPPQRAPRHARDAGPPA